MGSGAWHSTGRYYGAPWTSSGYQSYGTGVPPVTGLSTCTCGAYNSIIPPEPCPLHDPERAYWRRRLLAEFGGDTGTSTTTNTASIKTDDIPKYVPPKVEKRITHYNYSHAGILDKIACGADPSDTKIGWARVLAWVDCERCKEVVQIWEQRDELH